MKNVKLVLLFSVILMVTSCNQSRLKGSVKNVSGEHQAVIVGENKGIPDDLKASPDEKKSFLDKREALIKSESSRRFDVGIKLNEDEQKVDNILHMLRDEMLMRYYARSFFPSANSFFKAKADIESSRILGIIRAMPKGGILNFNAIATGDMRWVVDYAVKSQNCYVYWYDDNEDFIKGQLGFYEPGSEPAGFNRVSDIKEAETYFEQKLYGLLTLNENDYKAIDIKSELNKCFKRVANFLSYKPAFTEYYLNALENIIMDNVSYAELRTGRMTLYDLESNNWDAIQILNDIREILKEKHEGFDFKLIMTYPRFIGIEKAWAKIVETVELKKEYPDFIIGFDLIGDEFSGKPTSFYMDNWLSLKKLEKENGISLPLYLTDGMSNWTFNMNMYDAFLLNSKRIGHGLTLFRSPVLEEELQNSDVALEISPISNQVLKFTSDLRTHPANSYLRRGIQCVIGSDYMGFYGYTSPSFDFWEAFMAWELDLRALKKLSMNSIEFSGMSDEEKKAAMLDWQKKWDEFIKLTIKSYGRKFGY